MVKAYAFPLAKPTTATIAKSTAIAGYTTSKGEFVPAISKIPRRQHATVREASARAQAWRDTRGAGRTFATWAIREGRAPPKSGTMNMNVMNGLCTPWLNWAYTMAKSAQATAATV